MENQNQNNQIMDVQAKKKVTAKAFAAKFRSKREVFNFLSVDVGIYLPAYGNDLYPCFFLTSFFSSRRAGDHLLLERPHERQKKE